MCGRYRLLRRKQIIEQHFDSVKKANGMRHTVIGIESVSCEIGAVRLCSIPTSSAIFQFTSRPSNRKFCHTWSQES